jgi:DNA-binding response OmpR family regulator
VEDNRADVFLISEAIKAANPNVVLQVLADGEKALQFLDQADRNEEIACPALTILDINLPKRDGRRVLQHIRSSRRFAAAIVLVVTSSDSEKDREVMAKLGVNGYFRKPSDYAEFMKLGEVVRELLNERPINSRPVR